MDKGLEGSGEKAAAGKKKDCNTGEKRFAMVKEMHRKSLEKAVAEGKADSRMIPLCKMVSETKGFFTSSSCAGRIILLQLPEGESKKDASFHRKWHRSVSEKELWQGIEAQTTGELWFKLDPFILHIGTGGLEGAEKILDAMKKAGVKRGGIMVAKPGKFLIELQGNQGIALPVKKGKSALVEKKHLRYILRRANEKLAKNYRHLKKLEREFAEALK